MGRSKSFHSEKIPVLLPPHSLCSVCWEEGIYAAFLLLLTLCDKLLPTWEELSVGLAIVASVSSAARSSCLEEVEIDRCIYAKIKALVCNDSRQNLSGSLLAGRLEGHRSGFRVKG